MGINIKIASFNNNISSGLLGSSHEMIPLSLDLSNFVNNPSDSIGYDVQSNVTNRYIATNTSRTICVFNCGFDDGFHTINQTAEVEPLHRFHENFLHFHGYASIGVCLFGLITNMINISVLKTKEMRTPTNNFLIGLAIFDMLTMLPYIPYAVHFYCPPVDPIYTPEAFSYSWVLFMVLVTQLMATTHTISMWLAVSLAAFRFDQIRRPWPRGPVAKEKRIRKVRFIILAVTMTSLVVIFVPHIVTQNVEPVPHPFDPNMSFYRIQDNIAGTGNNHPFALMNILIYGILGKIVPCILIFIFSGYLIYHMCVKNIRRRQRFSAMQQQWKTTNMLLVVLILFIFIELPQGILILLIASVPGFYDQTYYYLGDLIDFTSLLNNAINFILYCAMSQQFREQFMVAYADKCFSGRANRSVATCQSETLTLRDGNTRVNNTNTTTTTTTTTHILDDQKMAKV